MNKKHSSALAVIISMVALASNAAAGGGHGHGAGHGHGGKDRMTKLDSNKDGKVTLAELTQSKQSWLAEVDRNKDGAATREEIDAHVQAQREKRLQELFQRKDSNKDGRLSREESGMPERWFNRNDENRDGALSPAELASGKARGGKHRGPEGKRGGKLSHMDLNGDGKIDKAEVTRAASQMLQRLDKSGDGALSADELGAVGKGRHRGKRERGPDSAGEARPSKQTI